MQPPIRNFRNRKGEFGSVPPIYVIYIREIESAVGIKLTPLRFRSDWISAERRAGSEKTILMERAHRAARARASELRCVRPRPAFSIDYVTSIHASTRQIYNVRGICQTTRLFFTEKEREILDIAHVLCSLSYVELFIHRYCERRVWVNRGRYCFTTIKALTSFPRFWAIKVGSYCPDRVFEGLYSWFEIFMGFAFLMKYTELFLWLFLLLEHVWILYNLNLT